MVILISLMCGRAFGGLVHPGDERQWSSANQLSGAAAAPAIDPWQSNAPRVLADAPPRQVQSALGTKAQAEDDDQLAEVAADDSLAGHPLWDADATSPSSSRLSIPTVDALAAATGGRLSPSMVFDAPDDEPTASQQQLVPLPPAGLTGFIGLIGAAAATKLRRFR